MIRACVLVSAAGVATLAVLGGCTSKLPTYQWETDGEALEVMRERARSVKSIEAACDITLTDPQGQSVVLDGAMAARNPGWLRLRAWKLNSAVFDLTMTPEGLWLMRPDSADIDRRLPAAFNAGQIAEAWALLNGEVFADDLVWLREKATGQLEQFGTPTDRATPSDRGSIVLSVDRSTLTLQRVLILNDDANTARAELRLSRYRMVDEVPWPHDLELRSDDGVIRLRLRDVSLNAEPAPSAFVPPRRAVRQP